MLILSKLVANNIKSGKQTKVIKDCDKKAWNVGAQHKIFNGHPHNGAICVLEVLIMSTLRLPLGRIEDKTINELGFINRAEFEDNWRVKHRGQYDPDHEIWIVEVEPKVVSK